MKKWIGCISAVLVIVMGLTGCGKRAKTPQVQETVSELPFTTLTIALIGTEPEDMAQVLQELNKRTKRDLNCIVEIEWIGWGEYALKYPMVLSTGSHVDLIYAANWLGFYENAERGAFAPLEELLEEYAPESRQILTEEVKAQATVNGHLYALPANFTNYNVLGVIARGDLMDKYGITSIDSFEDYLDFCDVIAKEEHMDPTGMCSMNMDMVNLYVMSQGYYPVNGAITSPYWVDLKDDKYTVYFQSECPGIENYLRQAQTWYEKGYWSSNVIVSKNETLLDSGLAASRIHNYDAYLGEIAINPEKDIRYYNLVSPIVRQSGMQDAMAIPTTSENKERAMMLLEKLRNDRDYYMLLAYGIEGEHYALDGNRITFLNNDYGNELGTWGFRDERYKCWNSAVGDAAIKMRQTFQENAVYTPMIDFDLDLSTIRSEYEAVKSVMSVYYDPLKLGYVGYQEGVTALNQALQEAGNAQVKSEIQRQIQAFMKERLGERSNTP